MFNRARTATSVHRSVFKWPPRRNSGRRGWFLISGFSFGKFAPHRSSTGNCRNSDLWRVSSYFKFKNQSFSISMVEERGGVEVVISVRSCILQALLVLKKVCENLQNSSNASLSSKRFWWFWGHFHETYSRHSILLCPFSLHISSLKAQ